MLWAKAFNPLQHMQAQGIRGHDAAGQAPRVWDWCSDAKLTGGALQMAEGAAHDE